MSFKCLIVQSSLYSDWLEHNIEITTGLNTKLIHNYYSINNFRSFKFMRDNLEWVIYMSLQCAKWIWNNVNEFNNHNHNNSIIIQSTKQCILSFLGSIPALNLDTNNLNTTYVIWLQMWLGVTAWIDFLFQLGAWKG